MPMTLGDFFATAPHARPVNPKSVTFTAVCKGKTLPDGSQNQHGCPISATITAALVFLGGDETEAARVDARQALRERFTDPATKQPVPFDEETLVIEIQYQLLWRAIYEWDDKSRRIGNRLFPSVNAIREMIVLQESDRLARAYHAYVKEEHPSTVDDATFRSAGG